jgi:hypothetical protein
MYVLFGVSKTAQSRLADILYHGFFQHCLRPKVFDKHQIAATVVYLSVKELSPVR